MEWRRESDFGTAVAFTDPSIPGNTSTASRIRFVSAMAALELSHKFIGVIFLHTYSVPILMAQ